MTTELEKEFFKVFGIEPKQQDACTVEDKYWQNEELANKYGTFDMYMNAKCGNQENCTTQCSCAYTKEIYPKITDRKLLEMMCIMNKHIHKHNEYSPLPVIGENLEEVKNYMLRLFNFNQPLLEKNFIQEIQQLFKEGE